MHLIEQSTLHNKTIMNSKPFFTSNDPKRFRKLYTAYWNLTPENIANTFNQYCCNIGPELAKTITPPNSASSDFSHSCTSKFSLADTSVEVICGIDYLKIGKALKVDDIPTKFLKMAKTVLSPFLSVVFNKCMVKGVSQFS